MLVLVADDLCVNRSSSPPKQLHAVIHTHGVRNQGRASGARERGQTAAT
jgi:hypothetical protein